jgi:hypothetical protein
MASPGGSITFGNSVNSSGKISYTVSMNTLDAAPSADDKRSIGKSYYVYISTPSSGSTTYSSGGSFSVNYSYKKITL